jgi:CHAT domain-containing protein
VEALRTSIRTLETERANLLGAIETQFPAYSNLIRPQAPTLAQTRAVLRPDEAHINIFSAETTTFVWAFKADGPVSFTKVRLGREELMHRVKALRAALDPGDADVVRGIPDFNVGAAYRLYADVLLPASAGWRGASHLLVVANDALSQLPLAVLPTEQATLARDPNVPYRQFANVPWLIRQVAFTQLPSANVLVTLRKLPQPGEGRHAFVGFGDPQFASGPAQDGSDVRSLRNLRISRVSQRDLDLARPVAWLDYGQIPRLPDTRDEILAMARALKADPEKDVFLGREASRANVKKLDLSRRRVIAFATHGLMAGDIPGVGEPSLALANPGDGKHGLLTLEDILGLKLDADWVVLSACNTAAGDGKEAEALSGLVRGFFYAGSRALLVTHWPVETVSARLLVTEIFQRQAADASLSRAEALRQSMLALMDKRSAPTGGYSYSHPIFWAPYALVGDGGN